MDISENKVIQLVQHPDLLGVYEQIELAGRTAYKSEDKIEYDDNGRSTTAEAFTKKMEQLHHGSVLEHGTVYLTIHDDEIVDYDKALRILMYNPYTTIKYDDEHTYYITTNYRVVCENDIKEVLTALTPPTEQHELRYTVRIICSRVQADSFCRHRVFSFLMESTRYVNYSNKGITIIQPEGYDNWTTTQKQLFTDHCTSSEHLYNLLIDSGLKPEDARDILPLQLKTELVMTGTTKQWEEFFKLRISEHAHPEAQNIAKKIKNTLGI